MNAPQTLRLPDGRRLETWIDGPSGGRTLMFFNGSPSSGLPYGPDIEAAARRGIRIVSWSRPGYGGSDRLPGRAVGDVVTDARAVLDGLGVDAAYVAGWSGGGPHALACAALMPERVLDTALLGGVAPYPAEGLDWLAGMGDENVEEFNAALAGPDELIGFMERAWPIWRAVTGADVAAAFGNLIDEVDRGSLTGEFADYLAEVTRLGLRDGYWGWFDDDLAFTRPWGFDLAAIPGSVHVWQGAHDRMVPFAHGQWLAAHLPGAVPHLLPEYGHLSIVVDSFARILDELVGGTPGG
jgi:pimeloyl-ACP methyl ester carboxylesterase